ncbi:hypothetical protein DFH94DRAFT_724064, partial [Russula ochroleuca]
MRSTALTALFFALFSLLSSGTSSPGSTNDAAPVIYDIIADLFGLLSNTPGAPQPTAVTASESSSAPITQPT